jgi:hypothetical protein
MTTGMSGGCCWRFYEKINFKKIINKLKKIININLKNKLI